MSPASWLVWSVSLAILLLLLLVEGRRARDRSPLETAQRRHATRFIVALLLVIGGAVMAALFLSTHETMNSGAQAVPWETVGLLYVAMIMGMVAHILLLLWPSTVSLAGVHQTVSGLTAGVYATGFRLSKSPDQPGCLRAWRLYAAVGGVSKRFLLEGHLDKREAQLAAKQ